MHCISHKLLRKITKSPPLFKYPPLSRQQIRILELHPGQFDCPIVITLHKCDLGKATYAYEALSYVWGDPTRKIPIECNGAKLLITSSLETAFRRLRFRNKTRILWIDAICINQDDLKERQQQVPYMGEIYPRAEKVLVWLGEADKKVELALKTIDEWAEFNLQYHHSSDATRFSKFEERFAFKPGYRDTLEATGELTYRAWFNRCWTFQEILLSTNAEILIGEHHLKWDHFYHALEAFPIHLLADDVLNFNALFMCHGKKKAGRRASSQNDKTPVSRNLSRLLQITRNFNASDPRDKIFSLLNVAAVENPSNFLPNYSISVRDTFISLTLAMIRDENSLNVLMSSGEMDRDKCLPSWCPDWGCKRGVVLTGYYDYISYDVNAGHRIDLRNLKANKKHELELEGALIDVVAEVYDLEDLGEELKASLKENNFNDVLSRFAHSTGLHRLKIEKYMSPEATLLRTLSADHWFFGAHLKQSYKEHWFPTHLRFRDLKRNKERSACKLITKELPSKYTHHLEHNIAKPLNLKNVKLENNSRDPRIFEAAEPEHISYKFEPPYTHSVIDKVYRQSSPFYVEGQDFKEAEFVDKLTLAAIAREAVSQAHFFFKGKKLFITKHKLLAIGTGGTRVGDKLCCLWGADVPFVLRQKGGTFYKREKKHGVNAIENVNELYEMVGESYVDGIMYGEIFHRKIEGQKIEPREDWIRFQKFRIC